MLLLGFDIGTSSVKASVVNSATGSVIASAFYPKQEAEIISLQPGWAEQSPDRWWEFAIQAAQLCHSSGKYNPLDIAAIGIAYQMHGLVLVDKQHRPLRNSIIWCDSRAVETGNRAFEKMGSEVCLSTMLNSPGNFTASKLAWVKEHEPDVYAKAWKMMLPGDYIALKLTGETTTTITGLSEAILWDFQKNDTASIVMDQFGLNYDLVPEVRSSFAHHGYIAAFAADELKLKPGIPVSYKAGDQPNNALALNVLEPGQVAATAGTSGVIYAVSDSLGYDPLSRVNTFAHVNHIASQTRTGILLCINGTGIFNKWIRQIAGKEMSYAEINDRAATIDAGSNGLMAFPFGNGAERMLGNKVPGARFINIDLNQHGQAHMFRAVQEGIAYSFRYGLDIMRENGTSPVIVRAARTNLFLSDVFTESFVSSTGLAVEFYDGDGSMGAAIGAGIGAGIYKDAAEAFKLRKRIALVDSPAKEWNESLYRQWKTELDRMLETSL